MFIKCIPKLPPLKGYTLVVPCVSVGNVGQLAADLIINTLDMQKAGYIDDDSMLPLVGNDPFTNDKTGKICKLSTNCEVYLSQEKKVIVIQQRAPFIKGKSGMFRERLLRWIKECGFTRVVIATSSHAYMMIDKQIQANTLLRYLMSPSLKEKGGESMLGKLKWTELESRPVDIDGIVGSSNGETCVTIPGGGIGKKLYDECCAAEIPTLLCLTFCSEGDNVHDAKQLATYMNQWFQWTKHKHEDGSYWIAPSSWRLQYGSETDKCLY